MPACKNRLSKNRAQDLTTVVSEVYAAVTEFLHLFLILFREIISPLNSTEFFLLVVHRIPCMLSNARLGRNISELPS